MKKLRILSIIAPGFQVTRGFYEDAVREKLESEKGESESMEKLIDKRIEEMIG